MMYVSTCIQTMDAPNLPVNFRYSFPLFLIYYEALSGLTLELGPATVTLQQNPTLSIF